jgi:IclR family transcriptional regulator, acetate operon repressor
MNSVTNTLRVIDVVAGHPGLGVSDVARLADLPKSTAQRCLLAAADAGWLVESGQPTRWSLATDVLARLRSGLGMSLRDAAIDEMRQLASTTGEAVHLVVRRGSDAVLLERVHPRAAAPVVVPAGHTVPLHAGATGKAILAALSDDECAAVVDQPLAKLTSRTLSADALRRQIIDIRRTGWAVNSGEWTEQVVAVAAAVVVDARPVAALSVSSTSARLSPTDLDRLGPVVAAAARRVSGRLAESEASDLY